jgi:hypothetical protein|tara:strand:- start:778 stop:975 length:198 start_codon:yes stop_codon:yes gene_type:complete
MGGLTMPRWSVHWTCCECENHFTDFGGEVEERMCYDCLDKEEDSAEKYSKERLNLAKSIKQKGEA